MRWPLIASGIPTILAVFSLAAPAQDRLVPEQGVFDTPDFRVRYEARVRDALLRGEAPYYLARVICLTAGDEGEWAVTLVRTCEDPLARDHPHTYRVEYAGAEVYLEPLRTLRGVKIRKARAEIDRETAEVVEEVWRRMLRMTRHPTNLTKPEHDETYHFSRRVPQYHLGRPEDPNLYGLESGRIWPHSSAAGSLTTELITIGGEMKAFALAKAEDREKVKAEVRARAVRLKTSLDRLQPPG